MQRTGLDQLLDFGDGDAPGRSHVRIEIARRLAVHEIALRVALPRLHECDIGDDPGFQDVGFTVHDPRFLAFRHQRARTGLGEEGVDAGTAGAHPLRHGALRTEFEFQLAGEVLPLEFLVLADIGGNHFADLARNEQQPQAGAIDARIVGDHGEIPHARVMEGADELLGYPAKAESPAAQCHAILDDAAQRALGIRKYLGFSRHRTASLPFKPFAGAPVY